MNKVFADTSGWASLFLEKDPYHAKASTIITQWQQQSQNVVTTNYVLSELIVLLSSFRGQQRLAIHKDVGKLDESATIVAKQKLWNFM